MSDHRHPGFTLIELLVVIAIIALLVSILVPMLRQAKKLAKMSLDKSNLHGLALADRMYREDTGNYPTPMRWGDSTNDKVHPTDIQPVRLNERAEYMGFTPITASTTVETFPRQLYCPFMRNVDPWSWGYTGYGYFGRLDDAYAAHREPDTFASKETDNSQAVIWADSVVWTIWATPNREPRYMFSHMPNFTRGPSPWDYMWNKDASLFEGQHRAHVDTSVVWVPASDDSLSGFPSVSGYKLSFLGWDYHWWY